MTDARWSTIELHLTELEKQIILWYGQAHVKELSSQSAVTKQELVDGFLRYSLSALRQNVEFTIDSLLSKDYLGRVGDDRIFLNVVDYPKL